MKHATITLLVPLLATLIALTTGCAGTGSNDDPAPGAPPEAPLAPLAPLERVAGTAWTCTSIEGVAVLDGPELTLAIDANGAASGHGGVNRWFGGVVREDYGGVDFTHVGTTRMAGAAPLMAQEHRYTAALGKARRWRGAGDRLELVDGETVLVAFARRP